MADDDDGGAGALGGGFARRRGRGGRADRCWTDAGGRIGDQRIDDDQGGVEAPHDGLEDGQITGEGEGAAGPVPSGMATKATMRCGSPPAASMRGRMVSRRSSSAEKRRTPRGALGSALVAGEGIAAGDAGGELAEQGALAETGIAVEDGDLAGGDATRPEPA